MSRKNRKRKQRKKTDHMQTRTHGGTTARKSCYSHRLTHIADLPEGRAALWAGSQASLVSRIRMEHIEPALVIKVNPEYEADFRRPWPITVNRTAMELLPESLHSRPFTREPAVLTIDCTDGSAPIGLTSTWWDALAEALSKVEGDIAVCCTGGHGRTGVVLSILAAKLGLTDRDPVAWVRRVYCEDAVETMSQVHYVAVTTGIGVQVQPPYDLHPQRPSSSRQSTFSAISRARSTTWADDEFDTEDVVVQFIDEPDDDYSSVDRIVMERSSGDLLTRGQ